MAKLPFNIKAKARQLLHSPRYAGVELCLVDGGKSYQAIILKREQGAIEVERKIVDIGSLEDLKDELTGEDIPIYLCIGGRGILHKLIDQGNESNHNLIQAVLPSAGPEQFYLQENPGSQGPVASIARKSLVDEVLGDFEEAGLWVTGLSLGAFDLRYLLPFLNQQSSLYSTSQQLDFDDKRRVAAISLPKSIPQESINVGDSPLDARLLLAYAAAFKGLMQLPTGLSAPLAIQQAEEYQHKRLFQLAGMGLLAFVFGALLLNASFYYYYKSGNEQLGAAMAQSRHQLIELDSLKQDVQQQEAMLRQTSVNQDTRISFYADQLGASLPEGLQLLELEIFPMKGRKRDYEKDELIRYNKRRIQIKGMCKSSLIYNRWIKELKELDWVQEARHINYSDLSKEVGEFELAILL